MAEHHKDRHDRGTREVLLSVGQLVYVRDHSARGPHKVQDLWSSGVYKVLKAPPAGGAVYTIAPTDDLQRVRTVHRDHLKARVGPEAFCSPSNSNFVFFQES